MNEAMRVLRARDQSGPADDIGLAAEWLRGPLQGDGLDVAVVDFGPGTATPPHVHHGGQVLVAVSGSGYVEVAGVRTLLGPGDVVVTPPGEQHVHGADATGPFRHLSVTTGRNELLTDELAYPPAPAPDE
jgi:quercetin dioxygenase-like cupin family protein